MDDLLEIYSKS